MSDKAKQRISVYSLLVLSVMVMVLFTGCSTKSESNTQSTSPAPTADSTSATVNQDEVYQAAGKLLKQNYDIFFNIFNYHQLPVEKPMDNDGKETIFPVKDDRFKTYADLEKYVRSTYVASFADSLLSNGLYVNRDGKLYQEISKQTGGGYYVDWTTWLFNYAVSDLTKDSAKVEITAPIHPPDQVTKELRFTGLTGKLIKENGNWLLEKIIE